VPNTTAYAIILLALALLALAIHWPALATPLQLAPLPAAAWWISLGLGILSLPALNTLAWCMHHANRYLAQTRTKTKWMHLSH
jgi:hypothetical protein